MLPPRLRNVRLLLGPLIILVAAWLLTEQSRRQALADRLAIRSELLVAVEAYAAGEPVTVLPLADRSIAADLDEALGRLMAVIRAASAADPTVRVEDGDAGPLADRTDATHTARIGVPGGEGPELALRVRRADETTRVLGFWWSVPPSSD